MESARDDLRPEEVELLGQWLDTSARIEGDAVEDRIAWLVAERLERVGATADGWTILYRDPRDGRYWELSHPYGGQHGKGPRRLRVVAVTDASDWCSRSR